LHDDYGYIEGTVGADGDEVDCYLGPDTQSKVVFVVDQGRLGDSSEFDEHKVFLGYTPGIICKKSLYNQSFQGCTNFSIYHENDPE